MSVAHAADSDYDQVKAMMLDILKNDKTLKSVDTFKKLVKAFTAQTLYTNMGRVMFNGNYARLAHYLRTLMDLNTIYGMQFSYKNYQEPLYRGMGINGRFSLDDYQPNSI